METGAKLLLEFGTILFFALLGGAVAEHLGLPAVLGYVGAGYVLGPSGLNIVGDSELVQLFSELGIMLLLFYIGLEISPRKFSEAGFYALFLSPVKSGIGFALGYIAGMLLGLSKMEAFVLGAALAVSSTAIVSQIIVERRWEKLFESRVALAMLILEDIFSAFFIAYLLGQAVGIPLSKQFLHTLLITFLLFSVGAYGLTKLFALLGKVERRERLPIYALGLITIFAYGVSFFGMSPVLGAFFAGMALAETVRMRRMLRELESLRNIFVLVFFTALGLTYRMVFSPLALLVVLLVFVNIVVQRIVLMLVGPLFGVHPRSVARIGLLLIPVGEFSLFFAAIAQTLGLPHAPDIMGGLFLSMILTTFVAGWIFRKEERAEAVLERITPSFILKRFGFLEGVAQRLPFFVMGKAFRRAFTRRLKRAFALFFSLLVLLYFTGYATTEYGLVPLPTLITGYLFAVPILAGVAREVRAIVREYLSVFQQMLGQNLGIPAFSTFLTGLLLTFLGTIFYLLGSALSVLTFLLTASVLLVFGPVMLLAGAVGVRHIRLP